MDKEIASEQALLDQLAELVRTQFIQIIDEYGCGGDSPGFGIEISVPPQVVWCAYCAEDIESAEWYACRVATMIARMIMILLPDSAASMLSAIERGE